MRPVGLIVSILRAWSQLRIDLVKEWLQNHNDSCFWGASVGKSCDRAGWEHNLLSQFATDEQLDCATLLVDLKKFYEKISHARLLQEAQATGYPVALLRSQCALFAGPRVFVLNPFVDSGFF